MRNSFSVDLTLRPECMYHKKTSFEVSTRVGLKEYSLLVNFPLERPFLNTTKPTLKNK